MPRSKFGKKRDPIDCESMKKAIEAVTASPTKRISIREACKVFNVKFATVVRHLKAFKDSGGKNFEYKVKYDVRKVFTDEEENKLIEYITTVAKMNYGLTKKGVRELAFKFAVANKKKIPLTWNENRLAGEEWMRLFLKRYSKALAMRKPEKTSLSRATSFNQTNVDRFFDNLEDVHKRFGPFPPNRIWNQDETGITTVQNPSKIVAPKGAKQVGAVTSSERGQLITLSTCVSATGNHIPPMMIFPRVHFKDFMLKGAPPGTIGGASPSGWSNETLYYMFMNHFIQQTKPTLDERVLLIIDNHESHLDIDTLDLASKAGVVIVTFPPHTSHKLQPLDVSVYFPFKAYYNQGVEAWLLNNPGKTFNIYCAAEIVGEAYPRAFTTINITKGFEKTGIYPLKRNIFNEDDFLPSSVTDRPAPPTAVTEVADHELPCTSSQIVRSPSCSGEDTGPSTSAFSPLTPVHSAECTTDYSNVCLVSPEEIQPYPKAEARKAVRKGRKPGRTKVATDTPEKEEIRNQKENKKLKKIIAEQKGSKKINKSNQTKKKRGRSIKKLHFESDSDSEEDVDISSHDEDELSELIDIINREELEMREEEDFERETFEEEDYVLVIFTKKKGPPDHYVAKIISKDQDGLEYQVMYYKRIGTSSKFIKESEEVFDVVREDIVVKLPKPIELEGSARIQGQLWFQIDFSNYNLK